MNERLFDLCELQLKSVLDNAENSVSKVTESSASAMELFSKLSELRGNDNFENEIFANIENDFNNILINMQFFDEFTQRVEHVREIMRLLKIESCGDSFVKSNEYSERLLNNIKEIFSIRSEYDVMDEVFPEFSTATESQNDDAIELF